MAKKTNSAEPIIEVSTAATWSRDMADFAEKRQAEKDASDADAAPAQPAGALTDWNTVLEKRKQHNSPEAVRARAEAREQAARNASAPDEAAVESAAVDLVREARAATQVVTTAELDDVSRTGQLVGIARHSQFMEATNRVIWLKTMQQLKMSGEYKHLPMQNAQGELVRPKNFAELCAVMGSSRSKVDEDLQNLAVFGGTLLEEQGRLGISYPELRAMRAGMQALPEDGQREVREIIDTAAKSGDKGELLAALSEMGVYNATLAKERDEAKAQMEAQKKVQSKTAKRANELEIRLEQALNPASESERQKNLADARAAFRDQLDMDCNALVGLVSTLCNHVGNTRKADTEREAHQGNSAARSDGATPIIDAALWEHTNARVLVAFDAIRALVLGAGLDLYDPDYADPDYGPMPHPENDAQQ